MHIIPALHHGLRSAFPCDWTHPHQQESRYADLLHMYAGHDSFTATSHDRSFSCYELLVRGICSTTIISSRPATECNQAAIIHLRYRPYKNCMKSTVKRDVFRCVHVLDPTLLPGRAILAVLFPPQRPRPRPRATGPSTRLSHPDLSHPRHVPASSRRARAIP